MASHQETYIDAPRALASLTHLQCVRMCVCGHASSGFLQCAHSRIFEFAHLRSPGEFRACISSRISACFPACMSASPESLALATPRAAMPASSHLRVSGIRSHLRIPGNDTCDSASASRSSLSLTTLQSQAAPIPDYGMSLAASQRCAL